MKNVNQNQKESAIESSAKTVDLAISQGLSQLNLSQDEVEIKVLKQGRSGIFGIGAEDAVVLLTPKPSVLQTQSETIVDTPPQNEASSNGEASATAEDASFNNEDMSSNVDATEETPPASKSDSDGDGVAIVDMQDRAKEILEMILAEMSIDANVSIRMGKDLVEAGEKPPLTLDITGQDLGLLIGRRGETLQALQFIIRQILSKEAGRWIPVVVDVEAYLVRRRKSLKQLAKRMADKVVFSRRKVVLEPMSPRERRIIHLQLRDHKDVYTSSVGERDRRKVVILPK